MNAVDFDDFWEDSVEVTLVRLTPGALNFDAQSVDAPTETPETVRALFITWSLDKIDGQIVQSGDRIAFLAAADLSAPPTGKDELELDSTRWQIVGVVIHAPDGEDLAYECHVRGIV